MALCEPGYKCNIPQLTYAIQGNKKSDCLTLKIKTMTERNPVRRELWARLGIACVSFFFGAAAMFAKFNLEQERPPWLDEVRVSVTRFNPPMEFPTSQSITEKSDVAEVMRRLDECRRADAWWQYAKCFTLESVRAMKFTPSDGGEPIPGEKGWEATKEQFKKHRTTKVEVIMLITLGQNRRCVIVSREPGNTSPIPDMEWLIYSSRGSWEFDISPGRSPALSYFFERVLIPLADGTLASNDRRLNEFKRRYWREIARKDPVPLRLGAGSGDSMYVLDTWEEWNP